jgi:predicted nucleic acid-binding protein
MYLDSSVLVKLYVAEEDSATCSAKVSGSALASSQLAYGEVWAALLAKERNKEIDAETRQRAWQTFLDDIESEVLTLFPLDFVVVKEANEVMLEVHPHVPLRTLDAIHVATFQGVAAGPLFTADKRMKSAARFLELPVID